MRLYCLFFLSLLSTSNFIYSQAISPGILQQKWKAFWIAVPNATLNDYGVYNFRKSFNLVAKPSSFIVHISADNRYKLYVNNQLACLGPARGDLYHWNFETIDISRYLQTGENVVSAVVWNFGSQRPEAQISYRTAFIIQGNSVKEEILNSDKSWRCIKDESYAPLIPQLLYTYYVSGPGEKIDMNKAAGSWKEKRFEDSTWRNAQQLFNGLPKGVFDWSTGWMLTPRSIPNMELIPQRLGTVRQSVGIVVPDKFPSSKSNLTISPNKKITILLDQGFLTNGYPVLHFGKGKDAVISLSYAEALYIDEGPDKDWRTQNKKGNRNEVDNKRFVGLKDEIISNGKNQQQFSTLWWRTWRYIQVEVETKEQELVVEDLYGLYTGYPFELKSKFDAGDKELDKMMEIGWRTAKLCAVETYMDCPYYEQLQYIGDTRIQALVSLFNSGDDRLMRNAIEQLDNSRMPEGITLSRYPTANAQEIPPFSLWWIGMLHDYRTYRPDAVFVKNHLPGMRQVLWFFSKYQQPDGSLKNIPYWNFADWADAEGWHDGIPPIGKDGNSASLDLQLLWAYQLAAELEQELGTKEQAQIYQKAAALLQINIRKKYWDASKQLFADIPEKNLFSQHSNSLAILTGTVKGTEAAKLCEKILSDTMLTPATIYFKYYVHRAVAKAGLGAHYLNLLGDWRNHLTNGLTTWGEISNANETRSDCHAWGSSPNIEFFRIVLGIDSDGPGFSKVKIEPHLGRLQKAMGVMPHPDGEIKVDYRQGNGKWKIEIGLPSNASGRFLWKGKTYSLKGGNNKMTI